MAEKRRLPLIQSNAEPPSAPRPAWHWVPIGVVAIFLAWIPLAIVMMALPVVLWRKSNGLLVVGSLASLFLACFGAGYLVGRFGERAGKLEATVAGGSAGFLAWFISVHGGDLHGDVISAVVMLLVLVPLFGGLTRFGAGRGLKARKPTDG